MNSLPRWRLGASLKGSYMLAMKEPESLAVFLGPSLSVNTAREILEARYLPPACRGTSIA